MGLFCALCGTEANESELASGRCEKCGSFYSITAITNENSQGGRAPETVSSESDNSTRGTKLEEEALPVDSAGTDLSSSLQAATPRPAASEKFVQPRKLSPQFERHIERTWQRTLASVPQGFQKTLDNKSETRKTKQQHGTSLSIGETPNQQVAR